MLRAAAGRFTGSKDRADFRDCSRRFPIGRAGRARRGGLGPLCPLVPREKMEGYYVTSDHLFSHVRGTLGKRRQGKLAYYRKPDDVPEATGTFLKSVRVPPESSHRDTIRHLAVLLHFDS